MAYDYREAMKADIRDYIVENINYIREHVDTEDIEATREYLNEALWTCDEITGNASGSYTFCRATAEEYVKENIDLAVEALEALGYTMAHLGEKVRDEEWEYLDVTIRCYLLGEIIDWAIDTV